MGSFTLVPQERPRSLAERGENKLVRELFWNPARRRLRREVLAEFPRVTARAPGDFTVHSLLGRRDLEMGLCSYKLLEHRLGVGLNWVIHDDGTLGPRERALIDRHLEARVLGRAEADAHAEGALASHPRMLEYRRAQVMALKLIDVTLHARGVRVAYVDSDIVFFRHPDQWRDALFPQVPGRAYFNRDIKSHYVDDPVRLGREVGTAPFERCNAGLWVMNRADLRLDRIDAWLNHPGMARHRFAYTLDQTMIAMLANESAAGVEHLAPTYDVELRKPVETSVCKHYVGAIRHGYELEGLRYVLDQRAR